jgi:hypothetical protein
VVRVRYRTGRVVLIDFDSMKLMLCYRFRQVAEDRSLPAESITGQFLREEKGRRLAMGRSLLS